MHGALAPISQPGHKQLALPFQIERSSVHPSRATHPANPQLPPTSQRMGVQAVMLSGDQPATAHAMAEAVGIPPQQVGARGSPHLVLDWLMHAFS